MLVPLLVVLAVRHKRLMELRPLALPPLGEKNVVLHLRGGGVYARLLVLCLRESTDSTPEVTEFCAQYLIDVA